MAGSKSVVVTFRVDSHLAEALDRLPDRSAFIRTALLRALHEPCPACGGDGVLDCDAAEWLSDLLERNGARSCACCRTAFPAARGRGRKGVQEEVCAHCGPDDHAH